MGNPSDTGSRQAKATSAAPLLEAVARLCDAEGLTLADLRVVTFADDEIAIEIAKPDGGRRINTYPLPVVLSVAALPATASSRLRVVLPPPGDRQTDAEGGVR